MAFHTYCNPLLSDFPPAAVAVFPLVVALPTVSPLAITFPDTLHLALAALNILATDILASVKARYIKAYFLKLTKFCIELFF